IHHRGESFELLPNPFDKGCILHAALLPDFQKLLKLFLRGSLAFLRRPESEKRSPYLVLPLPHRTLFIRQPGFEVGEATADPAAQARVVVAGGTIPSITPEHG
ncbi:MAG: hypothetical protein ACYC35_29820, partial [Pirellulales bacterium]